MLIRELNRGNITDEQLRRAHAELPFLSLDILRLRRDHAACRAAAQQAKAIEGFCKRRITFVGPVSFRRSAKLDALSARHARFWHQFYSLVVAGREETKP